MEQGNSGNENERRELCLKQIKNPIKTRGNQCKNMKIWDYAKAELLTAVTAFLQIQLEQ